MIGNACCPQTAPVKPTDRGEIEFMGLPNLPFLW